MPGFILHLTAAQMFLNLHQEEKNPFLIGSFLPDVSDNKMLSHFRNPDYSNRMVQVPDLTRFTAEFKNNLKDPLFLGYYFHLYVDLRFFEEYLPTAVDYIDNNGTLSKYKNEVTFARIKKSGRILPLKTFLSDEYYYGDYTRMNTYLMHRYQIPSDFAIRFPDPCIPGVNFKKINKFIEQMHQYLSVPENAVNELRVFKIHDILSFLEKIVLDFKIPV